MPGTWPSLSAVQAKEHDPVVAYDLNGKPVPISVSEPPTTPTLVLVPVETDFSQPVELSKARNINDQGGASIGTLVDVRHDDRGKTASSTKGAISFIWTCDDHPEQPQCETSPPPPPVPPGPPGIYFTGWNLRDDGEDWPLGEPELEVHVFGIQQGYYVSRQINGVWFAEYIDFPTQVWMDCAGEKADGYRYFDLDHEGITTARPNYGRDILIASTDNPSMVNQLNNPNGGPPIMLRRIKLQEPFEVLIIERDDGGACPTPPRMINPTLSADLQFIPYWDYQFNRNQTWRFLLDLIRQNDPVTSWSRSMTQLYTASGASVLGVDFTQFALSAALDYGETYFVEDQASHVTAISLMADWAPTRLAFGGWQPLFIIGAMHEEIDMAGVNTGNRVFDFPFISGSGARLGIALERKLGDKTAVLGRTSIDLLSVNQRSSFGTYNIDRDGWGLFPRFALGLRWWPFSHRTQ